MPSWRAGLIATGAGITLAALGVVLGTSSAFAAQPTVGLGTAAPFAVLAGSTVTNSGPSALSGDLGVSPGSKVTGFPPGHLNAGVQHVGDAVALKAETDLTSAYVDAAGRKPAVAVSADLAG